MIGLDRRAGTHQLDIFGQQHGQLLGRRRHIAAARAQDHRDRAAPVALPAHTPVAQAEIDPALGLVAQNLGDAIERRAVVQAIERAGVHHPHAGVSLIGVPVLPLRRVVRALAPLSPRERGWG